jgi:ferritin
MLNRKIEKLLNEQIFHEEYSSCLYLAMATWCDFSKLNGIAGFLYHHAEEERSHMLKFVHYLSQEGSHAIVPAIKQPPSTFKSVADIFDAALTHEKQVTKRIHRIAEEALEMKDFGTFQFLQWFVSEQQEEEQLFQSIVDKIEMIGAKDKRGLYFLDKHIAKLAAAEQGSKS